MHYLGLWEHCSFNFFHKQVNTEFTNSRRTREDDGTCSLDDNNKVGHWPATSPFVAHIKTLLVMDQEIPETHLYRRCARYLLLNHFTKNIKIVLAIDHEIPETS